MAKRESSTFEYTDAVPYARLSRLVGVFLSEIGQFHKSKGLLREIRQLSEAKRWLEKALSIQTKHLGERHPDTLRSMNDLALTLQHLGQRSEAKELYEKTLTIRTYRDVG